jgi:hypothetical protein
MRRTVSARLASLRVASFAAVTLLVFACGGPSFQASDPGAGTAGDGAEPAAPPPRATATSTDSNPSPDTNGKALAPVTPDPNGRHSPGQNGPPDAGSDATSPLPDGPAPDAAAPDAGSDDAAPDTRVDAGPPDPPTCGPGSCVPGIGAPSHKCTDGSTAGPVCKPVDGACAWVITECPRFACGDTTCADGQACKRDLIEGGAAFQPPCPAGFETQPNVPFCVRKATFTCVPGPASCDLCRQNGRQCSGATATEVDCFILAP